MVHTKKKVSEAREANVTLCVNHSQIKKKFFLKKKKSQSLKSEMFCHLN